MFLFVYTIALDLCIQRVKKKDTTQLSHCVGGPKTGPRSVIIILAQFIKSIFCTQLAELKNRQFLNHKSVICSSIKEGAGMFCVT